MTIRTVGLFSGFGLLEYGLELAGMEVIAQVEIEPYARRVLEKHWPDVTRLTDVRSAGAHNLPFCDLVALGYPCQDVSPAGKRVGISGPKSGLWREARRIISELRPRWLVIENTGNGRGRWLPTVLRDVAALGYDAEWHCLPAAAFGACHIRDRCFVVAYPDGESRRQQPGWCTGADWSRPVVTGLAGRSWGSPRAPTGATIPRVDRAGHGVPHRLERLRGLGNGVHVAVAEFVGRSIVARESGSER